MVRHIFFSFHFQRDHWRVNQVRQSWITQDRDSAGYVDAVEWEEVKKQSEEEIKAWIDDQLHGTSVTAVLIGSETADRKYVKYEIEESVRRGNGIVGIRVHRVKDRKSSTDPKGTNPLDDFGVEIESGVKQLSDVFETYDWKLDQGRENFGVWVEEAKQNSENLNHKQRRSVRELDEGQKSTGWGSILAAGATIAIGFSALKQYLEDDDQRGNRVNNGPETSGFSQNLGELSDPTQDSQTGIGSGNLDPFLQDEDSDDDGLF